MGKGNVYSNVNPFPIDQQSLSGNEVWLWILASVTGVVKGLVSVTGVVIVKGLVSVYRYKLVFIFSFEMGLTDSSRKVQHFKKLNWRGLLKTCDILLEQSGKSGGLPFEQSGKSRGLELEQSVKSEQPNKSRDVRCYLCLLDTITTLNKKMYSLFFPKQILLLCFICLMLLADIL